MWNTLDGVTLGVSVNDAWRTAFAGARVGLLALQGVRNPGSHPGLEQHAREIEARLRVAFAGADRAALANLPASQAYQRHYKAFGQTYHVLRQLESVVIKGRPLASPSALVLAMFVAELESLLLTAGHDLDRVELPLLLDCSSDGDAFTGLGGREHAPRPGDMLMRDQSGIISAVIYGPDQRTQLRPETRRVLYTVYAPAEITDAAVYAHLEQLAANVRLMAPEAQTMAQLLVG
jgi:DNA/RNA-binding domain of Phe-tRNA-synthetase-like protein